MKTLRRAAALAMGLLVLAASATAANDVCKEGMWLVGHDVPGLPTCGTSMFCSLAASAAAL